MSSVRLTEASCDESASGLGARPGVSPAATVCCGVTVVSSTPIWWTITTVSLAGISLPWPCGSSRVASQYFRRIVIDQSHDLLNRTTKQNWFSP